MEELEQLTAAKKSEAAQAGPVTAGPTPHRSRPRPPVPQGRGDTQEKIDDEAEAVNVAAVHASAIPRSRVALSGALLSSPRSGWLRTGQPVPTQRASPLRGLTPATPW